MNSEHGQPPAVDTLLDQLSQLPVPPDVQERLQARMQKFYQAPESAAVPAPAPSRLRRLIPACLGAGLTAALVLAATIVLLGNRDAWADVAKNLQSKPWIRFVLQVPAGAEVPKDFQPPESWYSAKRQVIAQKFMKTAHFVDISHQETFDYDPDNNTVTRSMTRDSEKAEIGHLETLLKLISEGDDKLKLPDSPIQIVERKRRDVTDKGRTWTDFVFTCRDPRRNPAEFELTIRVDPKTELPVEIRTTEKVSPDDPIKSRTLVIDYPETGPDDIYGLGVPAAAVVVDRRKAKSRNHGEIKELLEAYAKARLKPMEPHSTIGLVSLSGKTVSDIQSAFRAKDDGKTLQVEEADPGQLLELRKKVWAKQITIPDDADRARWWAQEIIKLPFGPKPRGDESLPQTIGYPILAGAMLAANPVPALDNPDCQISLDRHPVSGPPGTVRLDIVVETKVGFNDGRYWIDPERDYLVIRSELHFSKDHAAWNNTTTILDKVEKSPKGRWYATEARYGRIEKSGDDLSDKIVTVTDNTPKTGMEIGPATTSVFRYLVEFK